MAVGVRTRFEVFKRDAFTCQYCGRKSPEVILQVDHIVPVSGGGTDDPINLRTSCWECNSGKSDKPLSDIVTGEDPHDRAVMLMERERQLREYNYVAAQIREREEFDFCDVRDYWLTEIGRGQMKWDDVVWLKGALTRHPAEDIKRAMRIAIGNDRCRDLRYTAAILRNWLNERNPQE
jgi:hypothetical protein